MLDLRPGSSVDVFVKEGSIAARVGHECQRIEVSRVVSYLERWPF
jgi:hypothetical protein